MKLKVGRVTLGLRGFYLMVEMFGLYLDITIYTVKR